jgi:ABC-2 type transport system ATP-binding protein/lipopolysaccharide transport system ATP-binding protein
LGVGFHHELTGEENIYLNASLFGLTNKETRSRFNEIVDFSGLGDFIDTPVKNYSSGMYMRLGFSVAVHVEPDILLADEILAVGDAEFREKCHARIRDMQADGMALILVTHLLKKDACSVSAISNLITAE